MRLMLIVSVALVPALAFKAWTARQALQVRQHLVEQAALRLVRMVASQQQRIFEGAEQALYVIASSPGVRNGDAAECRQLLTRLVAQVPRYNDAAVTGLDGHSLCRAVEPDLSPSVADRAYFRLALQTGGTVIGDYLIGRSSGLPAIHVAQPFRDSAGKPAGVVSIALSLDWLERQLALLGLPPEAAVAVSDRNGIIIARYPDGDRYLGHPVTGMARETLVGDSIGVVSMTGLDGRPRVVGYSPLGAPPVGLRICVGLDRDAALAELTEANRHGFELIVLGGVLGLFATALLGGGLIGLPVRSLLAASRKWSAGDLSARTGLRHDRSEFGRLAAAFDAMAEALATRENALRTSERALRRLSVELEGRVQQEVAAREAAQARAAQAERLQALGQLAAGIAHDFNNVLQAIAGGIGLIERHAGDAELVHRLMRRANEAISRGASITRRLLAFGRRGDLNSEPIDAAALLEGMREVFVHTLGPAVAVELCISPDLPPLLADRGQLETALVNLATNARDAMQTGGRLTLSAAVETVDGASHPAGLPAGGYVRIAVGDTGAGMDAATLTRAIEPFFTTKPPGQGTGLGLSMVRGFVEQSGGTLDLASRPGEGTTVTLWLPQADAGARLAAIPPAGGLPQGMPARVLLVDDEALLREMLTELLVEAGFAVRAAAGADEALAMLAAGEPVDVLLTDLSMPGMDGLALIRAARQCRPGLPAILLTGYAGQIDGTASEPNLMLLRKPVRGGVLVQRIIGLMAGQPTPV